MKPLITLLLFTLCIQSVSAQKEINNWFYGYNSGNNFNNGSFQTVPGITNGPYIYSTSCSDAAGNLMFTFNGSKVIDRNLNTMPGPAIQNGATGHIVLAAASPANNNQFYLFY